MDKYKYLHKTEAARGTFCHRIKIGKKLLMFKHSLKILIGVVVTSATSFTSPIFATSVKTPQETINISSDGNHLGSFDIYNQIVRNRFVIKNSSDISLLFPKTVEEMEFGFHFVKNSVIACIKKISSISTEVRNFENIPSLNTIER